jgi:hypothetical protein
MVWMHRNARRHLESTKERGQDKMPRLRPPGFFLEFATGTCPLTCGKTGFSIGSVRVNGQSWTDRLVPSNLS